MTALLDKQELGKLFRRTVPRHQGGTLTLNGKPVPFSGASLGNFCRYYMGPYEAPKAFYVRGTKLAFVLAARDEAEKAGVAVPQEIEAFLAKADTAYLTATATDQAVADAAFIAICIGQPGDPDVIAWIMDCDDDEIDAALKQCEHATWEDDPKGFLDRAQRKMRGRIQEAMMAQFEAEQARSETSPPVEATGSSTPTASKARTSQTSNRKGRRQSASRKSRAA